MSRERRCWPYRECPYTKFSILTYAKREEPLKLICAVRLRPRTSGRTACTQRLNRRYSTGKSDVLSHKRRSKSALSRGERGEPAGNLLPARAGPFLSPDRQFALGYRQPGRR